MLNQNLSILERLLAPTPHLFAIIRNIAIIIASIIGFIIAAENVGIDLPEWLIYFKDKAIIVGGLVAAVISQLTVDYKAKSKAEALDEKTLKKGF